MKHTTACSDCGLLIEMPNILDQEYRCSRCHSLIYRPGKSFGYLLPLLLATIVFFGLSLSIPLLGIKIGDLESEITLLRTVVLFFEDGYIIVGIVALLGGVIIPPLMMGLLLTVLLSATHEEHSPFTLFCFRFYQQLREWGMAEVYLVSVLVTVIKLRDMSKLSYEMGLAMFLVYLISFYIVCVWFNPQDIWNQPHGSD